MSDALKSEQQKASESDVDHFRQELGPFVVAAETTRMPMVFTDARVAGNPIVFVNDSFLELTGYARDEVLGQEFDFVIASGADAKAVAYVKAAFSGETSAGSEISYRRKDGRVFCSAIFISPVRDQAGEIVQYFASLVDLTEHRQQQERSTMLIDELNHRVKNTLATVQSIVSQAVRHEVDATSIREAIETRLFALSRSHDLLTRENWKSAGLLDIVNQALAPFGRSDSLAPRFSITGDDVRVPPHATLALGLAFHELATNAVKYGCLANGGGSVAVAWSVDSTREGQRLGLHWRESGGPPVRPPSRRGFGSRLLERGLAHELGGTVTLAYPVEGVLCTMDMPLPSGGERG